MKKNKEKEVSIEPFSLQLTQMEERLHRMWDCLLQMSDKITEIKYLIKSLDTK